MTEEKRYAQISNESIQAWAETVGISDLSQETLKAVASDATYRLREVLDNASLFLRHNKRQRLTTDDLNRTLKWMDVPAIHGYSGSEAVDYVNIPDLGVHILHDPPVNLSSTALSGDIFHQPGSPYVQAEWAHVSGHVILKSESNAEEKVLSPLPLNPELSKYYQTLFSVIARPSNTLFELISDDVSKSPNLGPLVGPIIGGVLKVAQRARQKPVILRRLLLVIRALILNPYLHLGPQNYIRDIVTVLVFCVVTERKNPHDTQSIRTLAANILLMLSQKRGEIGSAYEQAVVSLSGVVASSTRPWTQHAGALTGLLTLGHHALHSALLPIARQYYERLSQILSLESSLSISSAIAAKDTLDANLTSSLFLAGFINILVEFIKKLPDKHKIYIHRKSQRQIKSEHQIKADRETDGQDEEYAELIQKIHEVYFLGEELFGPSFVLQVPMVYLYIGKETMPHFLRSSVYQEHTKSDETLLREFTNPTPVKRLRTSPSETPSQSSISTRERKPVLCSLAFDNYRLIEPVKKRKIYMCVGGCSTYSFDYLKQKKSTLPSVVEHPGRSLLTQFNKARPTGKMPHCTFTRPNYHPKRPCYSLNFLQL